MFPPDPNAPPPGGLAAHLERVRREFHERETPLRQQVRIAPNWYVEGVKRLVANNEWAEPPSGKMYLAVFGGGSSFETWPVATSYIPWQEQL